MISQAFAEEFAKEWIQSWNAHDVGSLMSHFHSDFVMSSPKIVKVMDEPSGVLRGRDAVYEYWKMALTLNPDLHFQLIKIFCSSDSIILYYRGTAGLVTEVFFFDAQGFVIKASANYE